MSLRVSLLLTPAVLIAFGTAHWKADAHGKKHNPVRYKHVIKNGIPAAYLGQNNPLALKAGDLKRGAELYAENCASCHGATGKGDSPQAKDFKPRPPELSGMMTMISNMKRQQGSLGHGSRKKDQGGMNGDQRKDMAEDRQMSMMTEGYLYWTLSEGGEALETAMPAFKDVLSEKERWQVILFMSNGFKAARAK